MSQDRRPGLSLVIPVFNEETVLPLLKERLHVLKQTLGHRTTVECIFINDGSTDGTEKILETWASDDHTIKVAEFSRNFGQQMAVTAGVDLAQGDAIVILDSDLQDPPELIVQMLDKFREGYDVVYAQRRSRAGESPFKLLTSRVYYWFMRQLIFETLPENVSDFRLLSRAVADVMREFSEHHRFYRGLVTWAGFRQTAIPFDRPARAGGETKWSPLKLLRLALDSVYSFSSFPLTLSYWVGGSALVTLAFLTLGAFLQPWGFETVSGFKTLLALQGITLICLGILGEYVFRSHEESKRRPLYIIRRTLNLDVRPGRLPSGGLVVDAGASAPRERQAA
jgi:dolichol-phosphate mannosyltransferase